MLYLTYKNFKTAITIMLNEVKECMWWKKRWQITAEKHQTKNKKKTLELKYSL